MGLAQQAAQSLGLGQATTNNGGQPILGAPVGDPASAGNPTTAPNGAQQYNGLVQNFGGNGPVTTTINGQVSQQTAPQGSSPSNPITWGQNVGGTFYDTSGAIQGAFTLDQINKMGYGRTADASGYHSIASTAQAYAQQAAPQQQQAPSYKGISTQVVPNQSNALREIGALRQRAQDAMMSGHPLSYVETQELNTRINDLYSREVNWNNTDELEYAKILDAVVQAGARDYQQTAQRNGTDGGDFNYKIVAAGLQAQDGLGFTRAVEAGGRAVPPDGNQQQMWLDKAESLGIPVSTSLRAKTKLMADLYNQGNEISGGDPTFYDAFGTYGGTGYKSMGMGAGAGYTNNDAVYGADPIWHPEAWGNAYEPGGYYDQTGGAQGQWDKFHNSNLSYGGGNYIGDPNYGKIATRYEFQGPTEGGPTVGAPANPTYADGGALSGMVEYWRGQGFSPSQIDQLIQANGGTLPPVASVPSLDQTRQDQLDAIRYYQKLTGGTSHPELGTMDGFREYAQGRLGQFAEMSGFTGGSDLNLIESHINDLVLGGPVGAPGTLTTSNPTNDVFSYGVPGQSQRIDNSGMLDGMLQGQLLGPPMTQPYGGWAYPVKPMPPAPAPVNAGLLNSILAQYYGGAR